MGNKLPIGEKRKSDAAVWKYFDDNDKKTSTSGKTITVLRNGKSHVYEGIDVLIFDYREYMRVDILLEDATVKDLDIHGSYRTDYNRMSYLDKDEALKIHADEGVEITIS